MWEVIVMSGANRTQADDLIAAVNAVNELNKAWEKGRKRRAVNDVAWRHALSEYMERGDIEITPRLEGSDATETRAAPQNETPGERAPRDEPPPSPKEISNMMEEIRRLTDEPERLLESHLGIFTEPAPPGRMLNSRG
jgi:hypothetical protein